MPGSETEGHAREAARLATLDSIARLGTTYGSGRLGASVRIAVDFGGTISHEMDGPKNQLHALQIIPGAREALRQMKSRGHNLLLYSHRANRARLFDPNFDPFVRAGFEPHNDFNPKFAQARLRQMLKWIEKELPGVFDAIDDGVQGKAEADLHIDNKTIHFRTWTQTLAELNKDKEY